MEAYFPFIETFPLNDWNNILALAYLPPLEADKIALFTVSVTITQIFIQYTLPMRSILWAMWYKELRGKCQGDKSCGGKCQVGKYSNEDKPQKSGKKKPSEKLIESSNKKYSSKKIDRNILRRAMEKEDND